MFGLGWLVDNQRQQDTAMCLRKPAAAWSPSMKYDKHLHLDASTYGTDEVFDVKPHRGTPRGWSVEEDSAPLVESGQALRCGEWLYMNLIFPKGQSLFTLYGKERGTVTFNGDIVIPSLYYKHLDQPFMSHTPMEVFTLRGGTRLAKGHTVIAGLGLGYQLRQVLARKQVKHVTLVEQSQDLVDWILPRVVSEADRKRLTVIVGDAYEEVPKLTADVALIDIFRNYGGNIFTKRCENIGRVWIWGSSGG